MIDLTNTSFIIPLFIESDDRLRNAISVLGFLNNNFQTNVLIHEVYENESKLNFLDTLNNLKITHIKLERKSSEYHRTKYLNELLNLVKTKVVCNYDIDVILPVKSYIVSDYLLSNDICDVVYPYGFGKFQIQISTHFKRNIFDKNFNISSIDKEFLNNENSAYGHCIFFKTSSYKSFGAENENFISYGPEDSERYFRATNFGLEIHRIKDFVYHFEHERTNNSNKTNSYYLDNLDLFSKIKNMTKSELLDYYSSLEYVKKYKFNLIILNNEKKIADEVMKFEPEEVSQISFAGNFNVTPLRKNLCSCGEPIDKIKYNFCQKCNRIY